MVLVGRKRILAMLAIAVVAGFVLWHLPIVAKLANIGSGYAAQQTCACVFVSHRELASCVTDLEPLARRLISVSVGKDEVTARAPLGQQSAVAHYEQGFGCSLRD